MTVKTDQKPIEMDAEFPKSLYQRYVQAAIVRSLAGCVMWFVALIAYFFGIIHTNNSIRSSVAVLYIILGEPAYSMGSEKN